MSLALAHVVTTQPSMKLVMGLSTDVKPTLGGVFIEMDTGKVYHWETNAWVCTSDDSYLGGGPHTHAFDDITGRPTTLAGYGIIDALSAAALAAHEADSTNVHGIANTANLILEGDARLTDARTPLSHTHPYAPLSHTHAAADVTSGVFSTARLGSGTGSPSNFLRGDGTWATPAGGSDPWTIVRLASNFQTSLVANTAVTGLSFTPAANTRYLVEGYFLLRTATATVGPRPGFSWPTGLTDGGARIDVPNSATAFLSRSWGPLNTQNAASGGVPDTTSSHLAQGWAYFVTGASPSGTFGVTLASETAGTNVIMRAESFIRYRTI